jgi:hypothetical protein
MNNLSVSWRVLALAFILLSMTIALGTVLTGCCELQSIEDKALTYIKNVLPIDFAHYNVTFGSYELPGSPNATYRTDAVTFMLNSSESILVVNCQFIEEVQYTCDMRVQQGSPIYGRSCSDLVGVAKNIFGKHETQTGMDSSEILRTLDMVSSAEGSETVTLGNVTLTVSQGIIPTGLKSVDGSLHVDPSSTNNVTSFRWSWSVDGEDQVWVLLDFENGNLHSIRDDRIFYAIVNRAEKTGQVEPEFASSLVAIVAVVLAVAFALCVGIVFYYKRRSRSREVSSNQVKSNGT